MAKRDECPKCGMPIAWWAVRVGGTKQEGKCIACGKKVEYSIKGK